MCGRYSLIQLPTELEVIWPEQIFDQWQPRYNLAPGQYAPLITQEAPNMIRFYVWGLIPYWAKDRKIGYKLINARAETLWEKPAFRRAARNSRCLVLADGFYEWKKNTGKYKQPYRIGLKEEGIMTFAGITERWKDPQTGEYVNSFAIITTEPNELTAELHDRMPAILDQEAARKWLDPAMEQTALQALLCPFPADKMKAYPVSPAVGNVKNDFPELLQPYQPPPSLFESSGT